ncbi:hypothetical protein J2W47_005373 [Priestia megaterium]|nr:hypothetical protein [Priestia megaterium]
MQKENSYWEKGSDEVLVSVLCIFLYIIDITGFSPQVIEDKMYKKCTFYKYEKQEKYRTYGKYMILFTCGAMHSSTSMNDKKQPLSNAMGYEVAFYFVDNRN